jgi:hypothetical protein
VIYDPCCNIYLVELIDANSDSPFNWHCLFFSFFEAYDAFLDLMWQSVSLVVCGGGLVLLQAVWYFGFLVGVCNSGFCLLEGICFPALLWPSWACILLVRLIVSSCTVAVYHKLFFLFIFSSSHAKEWPIIFCFLKTKQKCDCLLCSLFFQDILSYGSVQYI